MQPEARLSRDIRDALTARGAFVFKIHGGPTMTAGLPDLIACVPRISPGCGCRYGEFVGLESKIPGNGPSAVQAHIHDKIRRASGLVVVPYSVTDALDAVWGTPTPPGRV